MHWELPRNFFGITTTHVKLEHKIVADVMSRLDREDP